MGACMGACMGVVYITITYQHIAVLQFMMFVQHQISEELDEERFVWLYTL